MTDDTQQAPPQADPRTLTTLIARVQQAGRRREDVSLEAILDTVGRRSFAPFLLIAGLVTLAPLLGDIPGVPTLMGSLVVLVAAQMLLGRKHIWLPRGLLRRRVSRERFVRVTNWMVRPAHWIDRLLRARLVWLARRPAHLPVALTCLLIGLAMPPMELVPFTANGAGLALTLFGLALLAEDGLMALLGYLLTGGTLLMVIIGLA
ncbi:exopolysaccharide biosynthesis protein [Halomonas maura]|uniref:exopolysaccharide biosynthesis protein n=1 Tax=Halomonas maura TaxID=117606 RepID=UPI0025B297C7|nr:exopolysaccharide biosynthesis protein [Halomonas maura]MDN3554484.1 exopolysaccharide biosynthesis protein [Halomonas maura]